MNIEINTTEKTLIIKGLIAFSELIEFIKSKGFEDYSLKSETNYSISPYIQPYYGSTGGTGVVTNNCNTKL